MIRNLMKVLSNLFGNNTKINANAIAFTGHKSLLGPQGIGGFIIDDKLNNCCRSILQGGTGSLSYSLEQPDFLPDKFECGTHNLPGIIGLSESIKFINSIGLSEIYEHNSYLLKYFLNNSGQVFNAMSVERKITPFSSTSLSML